MEGIQIVLLVVIVTLSTLLLIVGVQVLLIILGVKRILRKVEQKIDTTGMVDAKFVGEQVRGIRNFIKSKFFKRT